MRKTLKQLWSILRYSSADGRSVKRNRLVNIALVLLGVLVVAVFSLDSVFSKIFSKYEKAKTIVQQYGAAPRGGVGDVVSAAKAAIQFGTKSFKPDPVISVPIRGYLRVEIIDPRTVCVAGNYDEFLKARFQEECGGFMKGIESESANVPQWSRDMFYDTLGAEIILKYRPAIAAAYNKGKEFKISNGATIVNAGYWVNPIGQETFQNERTGQEQYTYNAEVAHFAYLQLAEPLKEGADYAVENPLGETIQFHYSEAENISGAIKVNQLGYSPDAGRKYGYVGAWLGTLGKMDLARLNGAPFLIRREGSGEDVYEGKLARRVADTICEKNGAQYTGEDVYEMDFSIFNEPGKYHVYVPGVGRSYTFEIGENAIGEAFYVHAKGLYHKRCGIAKESPYTEWHSGKCHTVTYYGNFPPNISDYNANTNRGDFGFFDKDGKSVTVLHFQLIDANKTERIAENVYGGWHDAADYDRRPMHYNVVNGLLAVYMMHPENFADGQLNIPESGNKIPDILDEAIWGMDVWRRAQLENGAVGGWIEATSHPWNANPGTDEQRYYISAATRESSMQYAGHAAMLARALKIAGFGEQGEMWKQSAIKAYNFAINPANRFTATYQYPEGNSAKNVTYVYRESPTLRPEFLFKGAINLYLLTDDDQYLKEIEIRKKDIRGEIKSMNWTDTPLLFTEILLCGDIKNAALKELYDYYKETLLHCTDMRLSWLEDGYPYRFAWYPPNHGYSGNMGWGAAHPLRFAVYFIMAYEMTGDRKYRDAVYLCNDWHCGVNPFGQTMTSGLGQNYPIRFLDLPSRTDGIDEYVLGISPYRYSQGIARNDCKLAHGLFYDAKGDRGFNPAPTPLFSESFLGSKHLKLDEYSKKLGSTWPIWHRFSNLESYAVAISEYTVNETIAPAMTATAWLLTSPWKPSDAIKNRKPASDIKELKGYAPLP